MAQDDLSDDVNVIAMVKGEERYIFLYDDAHTQDALRTMGRYASNPELSFNWLDAALLGDKVRRHIRTIPTGQVQVEVIPPFGD